MTRAIEMNGKFWDDKNGGYYIGQEEAAGAKLPTRPKAIYDNAAPTGNSLALKSLVQLWNRTGEDKYRERAERLVTACSMVKSALIVMRQKVRLKRQWWCWKIRPYRSLWMLQTVGTSTLTNRCRTT